MKHIPLNSNLTLENLDILRNSHSYFKEVPDKTVELLKEYAKNTSMGTKKWYSYIIYLYIYKAELIKAQL